MLTLLQEVQEFHAKASFYNLSKAEIQHQSLEWQQRHGEAAAQAAMRTADPAGDIFGVPANPEDVLKSKMASIFEHAKLFKLSEEEVQSKLIDLVVDGHEPSEIRQLLPVIDPERLVFSYPVQPSDKGIHGLDLWENRYENFSDTYGHRISHSEHISAEFVEACEASWETGILYDHGGLSVDKSSLKGGYTVVVGVRSDVRPVAKDMEALKTKHGFDFECLSMVLNHNPKACGAEVVMATLITDEKDLVRVPEIACSMQDVVDRWAQLQLRVTDDGFNP